MKLPAFIAFRYLRSKRHKRSVSFISFATFIGITIAVMTLIAVLSVINGFQETIRDKIINTGFHVYVTSYKMDEYIPKYEELRNRIEKMGPDIFATPFFKGQVLVRSEGQRVLAADLQGVEKEIYEKDPTLKKAVKIVDGDFQLDEDSALIGQELAKFLGLKVGDTMEIISPEGKKAPLTGVVVPVMKTIKIKGIFKSGHYENDMKMVFVQLETAQELFNKPGEVWGIGVKIGDFFKADQVSMQIKRDLDYQFHTFSWMMYNRNFFVALKNEKAIMGFIVFLIMLVAGFNIASSLVLLVIEKRRDIGVLLAMGADHGKVNSIFLLEGMMLGGTGVLLGTIAGILLSYNIERLFRFIELIVNGIMAAYVGILRVFGTHAEFGRFSILAPDVYYLDKLPVSVHPSEVGLIALGALAITFISAWLAARQASAVDPVEAIRYE